MRDRSGSDEDSPAGIENRVPWVITHLRVLDGHRLHVRFVDGTEGEVDASELIFADSAGVFVPLRDPGLFAQAYLEHGAVTWPGDLDLAPDAMYDEIKANGRWLIEPFKRDA
jgi:hypothetical protein